MRRIGIVTIGDYLNYGNRLQNFALTHVINGFEGFDAKTIISWKNMEPLYRINDVKSLLKFIIKTLPHLNKLKTRKDRMIAFSNEYIPSVTPDHADIRRDLDFKNFDSIVLGSDQVWNFTWQQLKDAQFYMLEGVPKTMRIGYAVSMGNPPVRKEFEPIFERNIDQFKFLSVRETAAKNYLMDKYSVESEVVLDPTMLLSASEWENALKLKSRSICSKKRVLLTYFLSKQSKETLQVIDELKRANDFEIISLLDLSKSGSHFFSTDPREFVEYIRNADLLITDSFHATVFSIIFHTPFMVAMSTRSKKMNSRIDTLLKLTGIKNRILNKETLLMDILKVDFEKSDQLLSNHVIHSKQWLKNALMH